MCFDTYAHITMLMKLPWCVEIKKYSAAGKKDIKMYNVVPKEKENQCRTMEALVSSLGI